MESRNLGETVKYITDLQWQYGECAKRHDSLVDLVEKENEVIRKHNAAIK